MSLAAFAPYVFLLVCLSESCLFSFSFVFPIVPPFPDVVANLVCDSKYAQMLLHLRLHAQMLLRILFAIQSMLHVRAWLVSAFARLVRCLSACCTCNRISCTVVVRCAPPVLLHVFFCAARAASCEPVLVFRGVAKLRFLAMSDDSDGALADAIDEAILGPPVADEGARPMFYIPCRLRVWVCCSVQLLLVAFKAGRSAAAASRARRLAGRRRGCSAKSAFAALPP